MKTASSGLQENCSDCKLVYSMNILWAGGACQGTPNRFPEIIIIGDWPSGKALGSGPRIGGSNPSSPANLDIPLSICEKFGYLHYTSTYIPPVKF